MTDIGGNNQIIQYHKEVLPLYDIVNNQINLIPDAPNRKAVTLTVGAPVGRGEAMVESPGPSD